MARRLILACLTMLLALTSGCSLPTVSAKPAHYGVAGKEARTFAWRDARTPAPGPAVPSTGFDIRAWLEEQEGKAPDVVSWPDAVLATAEER